MIDEFINGYTEPIRSQLQLLRTVIKATLPEISESLDIPAKMIAYSYGNKYSELVCVLIPSKKGLKLGFNRGSSLTDPDHLLEGTGKISLYVQIHTEDQIHAQPLLNLLLTAQEAYAYQKGPSG